MNRITAFASATAALLLLAACQSPASYQPLRPDTGTGYTDQQLAAARWRVTFTGNAATKRDMVENYLLLRAAEITAAAGYRWFMFDSRDTAATTTYHAFDPWPNRPRYGWYHWPFFDRNDDVTVRPSTSYEAYAEIILMTDEQAKAEPRALAAQDVMDHIKPLTAPVK